MRYILIKHGWMDTESLGDKMAVILQVLKGFLCMSASAEGTAFDHCKQGPEVLAQA